MHSDIDLNPAVLVWRVKDLEEEIALLRRFVDSALAGDLKLEDGRTLPAVVLPELQDG